MNNVHFVANAMGPVNRAPKLKTVRNTQFSDYPTYHRRLHDKSQSTDWSP